MSIYFPGLDLVLSALYLIVIAIEAVFDYHSKQLKIVAIILAWQLPGLVLSLLSIAPAGLWGQANYAFFVLEFWYTPLLPLLSCLSAYSLNGKPIYFYLLLMAPVIIAVYYYLIALGARLIRTKMVKNRYNLCAK